MRLGAISAEMRILTASQQVRKAIKVLKVFWPGAPNSKARAAEIDTAEKRSIERPSSSSTIAPFYEMVHAVHMRLTVNLDQDVYNFTSAYAGAKGITLSAALGELVRRAEQAPEQASDSPRLKMSPHGYLVIAGTGDVLTPEMVKEASEDELV